MIGKKMIRIVLAAALFTALVWMAPGQRLSGQVNSTPSTKNGEWPMYTADLRGSKYSPLDQIDASNFNKLQVAWTFKTDNLGPAPEGKLEGTPLMVKGMIYATGGTRRAVVALDAKTGEQKWVYSMDEGARAQAAPRKLSGRGVAYWTDGRGDERILYVTIGYRLVSLNAKTGQPVPTFGNNGVIICTCSIASQASPSGRYRSGRFLRPTCRARRLHPRSPFPPSRPRTHERFSPLTM